MTESPDRGTGAEPDLAPLVDLLDAILRGEDGPSSGALPGLVAMTRDAAGETGVENLLTLVQQVAGDALAQGGSSAESRILGQVEAAVEEVGTTDARVAYALWRGRYEYEHGRPDAGARRLAAAAELAGDPLLQPVTLYQLGMAAQARGSLAEAEARFHDCIAFARRLDNADGVVKASVALAYLALGRNAPDDADRALATARQAAEADGDPEMLAVVAMVEGVAHARRGSFGEAAAAYERLQAIAGDAEQALDPLTRGGAVAAGLAGRISLYLREGEAQAAAALLPQLLAQHEGPQVSERIEDVILAGQVQLATGDLDTAKRSFLQAVRAADEEAQAPQRARALTELSTVYELSGLNESALRAGAAALDELEHLRASAGSSEVRIAFLETSSKLYEQVVQTCLILAHLRRDPRYRDEALHYAERGKSRALGDLLGLTAALPPPNVPADVAAAERRLVEQLRWLEGGGGPDPAQYAEASIQLESVWREIERVAPEYVELRRGRPSDTEAIRAALTPDRAEPLGRPPRVVDAERLVPRGAARLARELVASLDAATPDDRLATLLGADLSPWELCRRHAEATASTPAWVCENDSALNPVFFRELGDAVRASLARDEPASARALYVAGIDAAAAVARRPDRVRDDCWPAAVAFIERFPELRFAGSEWSVADAPAGA